MIQLQVAELFPPAVKTSAPRFHLTCRSVNFENPTVYKSSIVVWTKNQTLAWNYSRRHSRWDKGSRMRGLDTRRSFFGHVGSALVGCAIVRALPLQANGGISQPSTEGEDYYAKLGVTKIINAAGTYTHLTASTMPPSVQAAVARASKHPVHLAHLQKAAGEYLAGNCDAKQQWLPPARLLQSLLEQ